MNPYETPKAETPPPLPKTSAKMHRRFLWTAIALFCMVVLPTAIATIAMLAFAQQTPAKSGHMVGYFAGGLLIFWILSTVVSWIVSIFIEYKWPALVSILLLYIGVAVAVGMSIQGYRTESISILENAEQREQTDQAFEERYLEAKEQIEKEGEMIVRTLRDNGWKFQIAEDIDKQPTIQFISPDNEAVLTIIETPKLQDGDGEYVAYWDGFLVGPGDSWTYSEKVKVKVMIVQVRELLGGGKAGPPFVGFQYMEGEKLGSLKPGAFVQ